MTLQEALKDLIAELDRVHPDGGVDPEAWNLTDRDALPNFSAAVNGRERFFTNTAVDALQKVVAIIYENDRNASSVMDIRRFTQLARQCIVDLHSAGDLSIHRIDETREALNVAIELRLSQLPLAFTHYFPCWTLGMETEQPFELGPVKFMTREQWIDSVDFSPEAIERYLSAPEENARWKQSLRSLLVEPPKIDDPPQKHGLARTVYPAVRDCPSVLKVAVNGYDFDLSRKVGEILCKSALDATSLLFGGKNYFYQQALSHEHLPPMSSNSIVEMNGYLLLTGSRFGPRLRSINYSSVRDYLGKNTACLEALSQILNAQAKAGSTLHPKLTKRWCTALDWFAEGHRERNDAAALAKIATSLDVLACGGKFLGILQMLMCLLKVDAGRVITSGYSPSTLKQVVKNIYDKGRSQILHGTEFDRIKSFEVPRNHAAALARLALLESAVRLMTFTGPDDDQEFRSMPE